MERKHAGLLIGGAIAGITLMSCIAATTPDTTPEVTDTPAPIIEPAPTTEPTPIPAPTDTPPIVEPEVTEPPATPIESVPVTVTPPTEPAPIEAAPVTPATLPTYTLPPCATEDSDNCYWDAARMGNGTGTSFISLNGVLYFPEMR